LAVRVGSFGVALIFLSLLIFSSTFIINQRSEVYNSLVASDKIFSEFSAQSIYQDYITFYTQSDDQDFQLFKNSLEEKINDNSDLVNVALISVNGRILFDSSELKAGRYTSDVVRSISDAQSLNALNSENLSYNEAQFMGKNVLEYFVPISEVSGGHVLAVRYIFSLDSFNNQLIGVYRQVALSFLLVFIIMILLCIPFYLSLSRPITLLNDLAKKVSAGDFSVKAEVGPKKDEMSTLAESFNVMVDKLRDSKEKTIDSNKKILDDFKKEVDKLASDNTRLSQELVAAKKSLIDLADKNNDLEKFNKIMIDRELRITGTNNIVSNKKNSKTKAS
jgi:nitrogen fixation/metabolism regulation signal transduction histidine kinase